MSLPITSLPLPHSLIKQLLSNKIIYLSDIVETLPWQDEAGHRTGGELKGEVERLNLSAAHTEVLLDFLKDHFKVPVFTTFTNELLNPKIPPVVTFSSKLDSLLGGGVHSKEILELLGEPGSGCTQLCHQIAVDCTIPQVFGGRGCRVLYVDCDGDCCATRLRQMAQAARSHLGAIADNEKEVECLSTLTVDKMLSAIDVVRCTNYTHLLALINVLSDECPYSAVVIDSLATHFRHEFEDMRQRTNILAELVNKLHGLCLALPLSIVLVNQVRMGGEGSLLPCLGESWSHTADRRVLLRRSSVERYTATLMKSPEQSCDSVDFRISSRGIRDCPG